VIAIGQNASEVGVARASAAVLVLRGVVFGLGAAYAITLLPGVRGGAGFVVLLDGWVNNLFTAGVIVLTVVRALGHREGRGPWLCLAGALTTYFCGVLAYYLYYLHRATVPYPSWSDFAWMLFYPLAYVALFLMLRDRVPRLSPSMWFDGIIASLTAAAFAVAFALRPALEATQGSLAVVATNLAYPVADLLLLGLVAAALTVIGRGAGASWWWLTVGLAMFAVTDTVYAYQIARGTYVDGALLDLGWVLAVMSFGLAACQRPREGVGTAQRLEGLGVLAVPGVCALSALGLLFYGYLGEGDAVAGTLALGAVLAALGRTALTFREVRALAASRRQARTDELTGLPNRRSVYEALIVVDAQIARGRDVAVLLIDLDRFKEVNDSVGHAAGDALLRQVGSRLAQHLRHGDLLARLGGDEFVLLAHGLDAAEAQALATRLRSQLQQPFEFSTMSLSIDASIGISLGPHDSHTGEELLQLADLAMYVAKTRRIGVAAYDQKRDGQRRHRIETVEQLRSGMRRGELLLHYQPKITLKTHRVTGVEALVRWQHPTRGLLYPESFIDIAESFGLMAELTRTVLEAALAQCRSWADHGHQLNIAVNISPCNLVDEHFPDEVAAALRAHRIAPTALTLEVTESQLMQDRLRAVSVLSALRQAGVGIAIDDYGTGYSSLAYLAELPVTELKIDRAFIGTLSHSPRNAAIVTSTLQLAHALGLIVVAEGVEDQATVETLQAIGCDVTQGYHLSPPLPAAHLSTWLQTRASAIHDRLPAVPAR